MYHPAPGMDPFGPPVDAKTATRLLAAVRDARYPEAEPPFTSPLADGVAQNDTVPVRFLHAPTRGDAWVILAPPYGSLTPAGDPGLYAMHAAKLAARGFGVALLPLPFHGARGHPGRPSGWGAVVADLGRVSRTLSQAAADAVALARHLREERGAGTVLGLGISLGGVAVGLGATQARDAFDGLGLIAAVDNPVSFYYTGATRAFRRVELAANGFHEAEVKRAFAPFAPSTYAPPFPGERAVYAIPTLDTTVPARWQEAWRRAWGGRRVLAFGHGHVSAIVSPGVAWRVARAMAATVSGD